MCVSLSEVWALSENLLMQQVFDIQQMFVFAHKAVLSLHSPRNFSSKTL